MSVFIRIAFFPPCSHLTGKDWNLSGTWEVAVCYRFPPKSFLNLMCTAPFVMVFCLKGETDTSGLGAWDSIWTLQPLLLGFPAHKESLHYQPRSVSYDYDSYGLW